MILTYVLICYKEVQAISSQGSNVPIAAMLTMLRMIGLGRIVCLAPLTLSLMQKNIVYGGIRLGLRVFIVLVNKEDGGEHVIARIAKLIKDGSLY